MFVVIIWFAGYLSVMSLNHISASKIVPQMRTVDWTNGTIAYACIMWFGLIWSLIVVDYAKNFIVLFASSTYYFNSPKSETDETTGETIVDGEGNPKILLNDDGKQEDGSAEVCLGIKLAHFKHLGSICFGACLIAIIKVIRFLFVYLAK